MKKNKLSAKLTLKKERIIGLNNIKGGGDKASLPGECAPTVVNCSELPNECPTMPHECKSLPHDCYTQAPC